MQKEETEIDYKPFQGKITMINKFTHTNKQ